MITVGVDLRRRSKHLAIFLGLGLSLLTVSLTAKAGEWASGKASNVAGSRNYSLWIPSGYDKTKATPLVMMLHGCTQTPQDFATLSGMNSVADKNNVLVVYPEQPKEANPLRCWNWFDAKHQERNAGEPSLLADIVRQVSASNKLDSKRIYVAGMSAGAAMAVVMGFTYPDVFSAIGVNSGLAYQSAKDVQSGMEAMKKGGPDPMQPLSEIEKHWPGKSNRRMPVIVFQGDADPYVNLINAEQVLTQWARINDYLDDGKDNNSVTATPAKNVTEVSTSGRAFIRSLYNDRKGKLLLEKWIVKEMGHAWSGSPITSPFADPKAPNASEEMWRFFVETQR